MGKKTTATKKKKTTKAVRKATPQKKAAAKKPAAAKKTPARKKSAGKSVKKPSKKSNSKAAKTTAKKSVSKPAKKLPAKSKPAAKSKKSTATRSKVAKTPTATKGARKSAQAGAKPANKAGATKNSTVTKSSTKSPVTKTAAGAAKAGAAKSIRPQASRGSAKAFTLEDALGEIERSSKTRKTSSKAAVAESKAAVPKKVLPEPKPKQQKFGAASLADILGYNPANNEKPVDEISQIPKKYLRYYKLLIQLRDHVDSGLTLHAEDTLKRSNREDSGDLSGYGQHMADAGTDNFDRDFALSLVSNEQEALYEIQEAIQRIKKGTYGICETSGKPIPKERLLAVPFARYSVESQADIEKHRRFTAQRAGVFAEATGDEGKFLEDNSD